MPLQLRIAGLRSIQRRLCVGRRSLMLVRCLPQLLQLRIISGQLRSCLGQLIRQLIQAVFLFLHGGAQGGQLGILFLRLLRKRGQAVGAGLCLGGQGFNLRIPLGCLRSQARVFILQAARLRVQQCSSGKRNGKQQA